MIRKILNWIPALLWATFIFYLSSKPGLKVATGFWDFATRKPAHILVYFILYLLVYYGLVRTITTTTRNLLATAFLLTIFYGGTDEIHQSLVPLREGKISDIIWDAIGALVAFVILWKYFPNLPERLKRWLKS